VVDVAQQGMGFVALRVGRVGQQFDHRRASRTRAAMVGRPFT
jgi:hypothetical protein